MAFSKSILCAYWVLAKRINQSILFFFLGKRVQISIHKSSARNLASKEIVLEEVGSSRLGKNLRTGPNKKFVLRTRFLNSIVMCAAQCHRQDLKVFNPKLSFCKAKEV
jgi:hypothetical protein